MAESEQTQKSHSDSDSEADQNPEATYANYLKAAPLFKEVAKEKSDWIQAHIRSLPHPDSSLIIEIGPGLGSVLKNLRSVRPQQALLAIENQPRFADQLQADGFAVLADIQFLKNHPLLKKKHVLVFMDNVLEHIPRPAEFLKQLKLLIFDSQNTSPPHSLSLLIEVPNEFGIGPKAKIQDFIRGFSKPPTFPGHINLFTKATLRRCADLAGFRTTKIESQPIRSLAQIRYLSQSPKVSALAQTAVTLLNVIPVDEMLGMGYWLRMESRQENPEEPS